MSMPIVTIDVDTPIREAADILISARITGALVIGSDSKPAGVVSLFDIADVIAGLDRPPAAPGGFYEVYYPRFDEDAGGAWGKDLDPEAIEEKPIAETTVGDAMTTEIVTVPLHATAQEIAAEMSKRRIHRVIVDGPSGPVGIVSSMDILNAAAGRAVPRAKGA
jgi:CBS domain-containing protein